MTEKGSFDEPSARSDSPCSWGGRRLIHVVETLLVLWGLVLLLRPLSAPWQVTQGLGLVLLGIGGTLGLRGRGGPWRLTPLIGAAGGWLVGLAFAPSWYLPILAAAVLLFLRSLRGRRPALDLGGVVAMLLAAHELLEGVPWAARWLSELDEVFWRLSSMVTFGSAHLGLSTFHLGFPFLVALLVAISTLPLSLCARGLLAGLSVATVVPGLALYHILAAVVGAHHAVQALPLLLPVLASLPAALWSSPVVRRNRTPAEFLVRGATGFAVGASLVVALWPTPASEHRRITVLERGLQDWEVPHHGSYGEWSAGMFGDLERLMRAYGHTFRRVDRLEGFEDAGPEALLLIVNLNEMLHEKERCVVDRFLRQGGTCLVLADHTNVAGLMGPTNALTSKYGIRVRFDSAVCNGRWTRAFAPPGGRMFRAAADHRYFAWSIGASLDLSGPAEPLLRGRLAFSDHGVETNYMGAYLGDYTSREGEEVGGVILVARTRVGRGQILVFGDTTPFQNTAVRWGARGFLSEIFGTVPRGSEPSWGLLVAGLGAIVFLASFRLSRDEVFLGGVLSTVFVLHVTAIPSAGLDQIEPRSSQPVCVSLWAEPLDQAPTRPNHRTVWPLEMAAERAGFLVVRAPRATQDVLERAKVVLIALPLHSPGSAGVLERYVREGGAVVFVGGPAHAEAIRGFLDRLGVSMEWPALGPFPKGRAGGMGLARPRLPSAYSVATDPGVAPATDALMRQGRWTPVVRVHHGDGQVVIIGDDALPYGSYLEGSNSWHLGNIAFLDRIWRLLGRREVPSSQR